MEAGRRSKKNTLGYGVIGNTDDSGSFVLGSSPGTPAIEGTLLDTFASGFLVLATSLSAVFQIAIVFGAPLGAYSYGGLNVGKLSSRYRTASVLSAGILFAIAGHYLAQLGVFQPLLDSAGNSVVNWGLVALFALSAVMNNISRSRKERIVWGALTVLMFFASLTVALDF